MLIKQELEHDEIFEDTWEAKENEWLSYVKNDVLSTAFCFARFTLVMEELTRCGMKKSINLPSLPKMFFSSLRDENDETIYTYTDNLMITFARKNMKGGQCSALYQNYKSIIFDDVFNNPSAELDIQRNVCEILDKYFEYTSKHRKTKEDGYYSQFKDKRKIDQDEKSNHVNDKLSKLPIQDNFENLDINEVLMDFVTTSLYPKALYGENNVYSKIGRGYALKPYINDV